MSKQVPLLEIRNPKTERDIEEAKKAQELAWGALDLEDDDIPQVLANFPEGFFAAYVDDVGAGNFYTARLNYDIDAPPPIWEEISGQGSCSTHTPDGHTLYGISLGVAPAFRGMRIGQQLVQRALEFCVEINCKRLVLGCRIPDYHKHSDIPVEEYITLKRDDGQYLDPELRFYSRCGLHFTKAMPEYMSGPNADPDSLNYGVMSIWDNPHYKS